MRHLLYVLLLSGVYFPSVAETNSDCRNPVVIAEYEVAHYQAHGDVKKTQVTLVRNHHQVAYRYHATAVTELWEQTSTGQLRLVRNFDQHQRGIEYQPAEIRGAHDWAAKRHLISPELFSATQVGKQGAITESGEDCTLLQTFKGKAGASAFDIVWQTSIELPKVFSLSDRDGHLKSRWTLKRIEHDVTQVDAVLAELSHYQTTDFADIGDNESDPFLMQMINLGFVEHGHSGHYDANGHSMGSAH